MTEKKSKLVEIQTKPTTSSVLDFINKIADEQKRKDSLVLMELMRKVSGEEPVLWSNSLIGFGNKRYKSPKTGREVDWLLIGFSPRKANLSLHLSTQIGIRTQEAALQRLGKHKADVGCLYINKLEDVDLNVLEEIIKVSLNKN